MISTLMLLTGIYSFNINCQTVVPLTVNALPRSASIGVAGESDLYSFTSDTRVSSTYTIQTYTDRLGVDTYMYLYRLDGTTPVIITEDDDSGIGNNASITWTVPANVTRYIRVRAYSSTATGGYYINVVKEPYYQPPREFTGTAAAGSVTLSWLSPWSQTPPLNYNVYIGDTETGTFTATPAASNSITLPQTSGTTRWYYITAVYTGGESSGTAKISLTSLPGYLSVSPPSISLPSVSGSSGTFAITSTTTWSATPSAGWLSVSPPSGTNNGTVTVTATSANTGTNPRIATVTIAGSGVANQTVTVTQGGALVTLTVDAAAINATISTSGDIDLYRFLTGAAGIYTIQTYGNVDTYMRFYGNNMTPLLEEDDDDGTGANAMISRSLSANTWYYATVTAFSICSYTIDVRGPGTSTGCINETFTAASGTITDNSGALDYQNNMTCEKLIQPSGGGTITLTFTSFATESGYDFVRVYGGTTTSAPLLGTFSGSSLPPVLTSAAGSMLIRFTTDASVVAAGWSATYTTGAPPPTGCINETFTAASGTITDNSGALDYQNNMACEKLIQPSGGGTITLTFTSFATESGYDFVRVYGGTTTSAPLLGTFSGSSLPPVLTSAAGSMLIRFTTDGSVVTAGWSATYTTGAPPPTGCINETFTAASGTITDNSGALDYQSNMACEKLIQPSGGGTITLTFTSFATESGYDFVRVYGGTTTSAPLLGTFSGSSLPPVLTSAAGSMLIRFTTDASVVAAGWSATYTTGAPPPTGCINETFTAASGTITDNSGALDYQSNMACEKLIQPSGGGTITLTFTSFATESGYDFVRVYGGTTTSAPLLGTFSGSSLPPVLTSSAGSTLIRFTTDGSVVAAGWSATYTTGTAAVTLVLDIPVDASISIGGENDWYRFQTGPNPSFPPGQYNTYTIRTYGSLDTYMYLYESDGTTLIYEDDDSGEGNNAEISRLLPEYTWYYVRVRAYSASVTGSYSIAALNWWNTKSASGLALKNTADILVKDYGTEVKDNGITLNIFPNPGTYEINVVLTGNFNNLLKLEIVSSSGRKILSKALASDQQINEIINVQDFPSGMYFVRIVTSDRVITSKFIKE